MMLRFLQCIGFAFVGATGMALALVAENHGRDGTGALVLAIFLGGMGGGFTLVLIGGERYGLKLPGTVGGTDHKYDPGYLGDIFVGVMSAFLGIGVAIYFAVSGSGS